MLRILLPPNGKGRQYIKRIINRRRLNFKKRHYNSQRVAYYKSSVRHAFKSGPLVSIVVPAYNTPARYLEPLLDSIFAQGYENWELVLVDASDDEAASKNIHHRSMSDSRITYVKVKNEGIAENTNVGIRKAGGEFVALLDHDDTLDPDALARSVQLFTTKPTLGLVYSDEDKVSDDGDLYFEPHFKPDFSLDMLRSVNYITHFVVVRASIAKDMLIRKGFEGAQDFDFLLRVVDSGAEIGHTVGISYHWRQAQNSTAANFSNKKHVTDAGVKALKDHYKRRGINNVNVTAIENRPGFYRADYNFTDGKKRAICINIPNQTGSNYIEETVVDIYKKNKDVIENQYDIVTKITESQKKKYVSILYVNDIIIPTKDTTTISNLLALAEEDGVFGVTPRINSCGGIYDLGLVAHDGLLLPLGKNTAPGDFSVFGSYEWSRDVAGLTGNVIAVSSRVNYDMSKIEVARRLSAESTSRKVVCGDSEFVKLYSTNIERETTDSDYYNENLSFQFMPIVANKQYIEEMIDVEK